MTAQVSVATERKLKRQALCIVGGLLVATCAALIIFSVASAQYPTLASPGILAFSFGLRHAVDADHIAAIDNVTRKLVQDGKFPLTVGLWFSLGHSSVVCIMCLAVVTGSSYLSTHLENAKQTGAIIGTLVSSTVLFVIGFLNLYIAYKLWSQRRHMYNHDIELVGIDGNNSHQHSQHLHHEKHEHTHIIAVSVDAEVVASPGVLANCCSCLFQFVDSPWKMYPIGFLFGLGFDTASEVALLALTALSSKEGVPHGYILLLPLLFSVGMALVDTLDGMMMLWAYGWASIDPATKLVFNLFLTVSSALIALIVGLVEVLGCLQDRWQLTGGFWIVIRNVNERFELVGYSIVAFFFASSVIAMSIVKCK